VAAIPVPEPQGKPVKGKGKKGAPPAAPVAPVIVAMAKAKPEPPPKSDARPKASKPWSKNAKATKASVKVIKAKSGAKPVSHKKAVAKKGKKR
jgi:hypothetical protein